MDLQYLQQKNQFLGLQKDINMKIFYYKKGFYFEGVNSFIPKEAVEISKEYYDKLLNDMSNGRKIDSDENGYPISLYDNEYHRNKSIKTYNEIFENYIKTPVLYTNGLYYCPEYVNDLSNILQKMFDDDMTVKIWYASGKEENVREMNKKELIELTKFLFQLYEEAYQDKRKSLSVI